MRRRDFLTAAGALGLTAAGAPERPASGQPAAGGRPLRIVMGGYGPSTTGFSRALERIGTRISERFGDEVEIRYVYNIMDLGYRASDILWLVEQGILTLGYQSSSYLGDRIPGVGIADLPFLFADSAAARAALDGDFGAALTARIEAGMDYRILGYFENGFRHISNRLHPIRTLDDLRGLKIRVLTSEIHARTFELLGAAPEIMDLSEALRRIRAGTLDAQENPFANTVTYGVHEFHKFHSITGHFYISRPIFVHRPAFDGWPEALRSELRDAVRDAVGFQRKLHEIEEAEAAATIRESGGQIVALGPEALRPFRDAVIPLYADAHGRYDAELVRLAGI
jgi:tripartite ATP-independent transporter DctP family solute receptor